MKLELYKPAKKINKGYLKQDLNRDQIDLFKMNLKTMFTRINDTESEEHLKNIVSDFLKDTFYKHTNEINTKDRKDLVIHNDKTSASSVGVIIEVKRPGNKTEMISENRANAKAFHELLHYYLNERYIKGNKEIKHLIITNIYDWYIFDGADFEKFFFDNPNLIRQYKSWVDGLFGVKQTDWFYQEIAKPFIEKELEVITCVYVNLKDALHAINNPTNKNERSLIDLYKILSGQHLLKHPFINESNTLKKDFYYELLYIIGLQEFRDKGKGKRLIRRMEPEDRNPGSLIENTINILKVRDKLSSVENILDYGDEEEDQLFSIALELCITWLNRILFLKLLEGQLKKYHSDSNNYSFLNALLIKDYDELNELFFEVIAIPYNKRTKSVTDNFANLPYLNSSLFEESSLETKTLVIADLKDRFQIPIFNGSVLKSATGDRLGGTKLTLAYLFEFLDAYNFASDSKAEIQEQKKTMINASVLGLIFEKINGYKDGSFFTPGFITMYMCRDAIRKAVIDKFNLEHQLNCTSFNDLYNKIDKISIKEANQTINGLKICDPAVGSGHFLVSALNEIISIKNDLGILTDASGKRLRGYNIVIENDELITTYEDEIFEYNFKDPESQRIQETFFHEKQLLIENCLFGVDINGKSVMICRLRLWIELLKNSYYTKSSNYSELETLPNIDINIKHGNSLIHRFDIHDNFTKLPGGTQQKIRLATDRYKSQILIYKSTNDKATRKLAEKNIIEIKKAFSSIINPTDPDYKIWQDKERELIKKQSEISFGDVLERKQSGLLLEKLIKESNILKHKYDERMLAIYSNAFEWRFEFPEVLDDNGDFLGFDVLIGNPPYIRQEKLNSLHKEYFLSEYNDVGNSTADIYVYFFGLALKLSKKTGYVCFITLNKWLKTKYGNNLRSTLEVLNVHSIIDFFELPVFEEASTDSSITLIQNDAGELLTKYYAIKSLDHLDLFQINLKGEYFDVHKSNTEWSFTKPNYNSIIEKLNEAAVPLAEFVKGRMYMGIKTGCNEIFIIPNALKEKLCELDPNCRKIIQPYVSPMKLTKYNVLGEPEWLINTQNGVLLKKTDYNKLSQVINGVEFVNLNGNLIEVFRKEERSTKKIRINRVVVEEDYPEVYKYLNSNMDKLINREDQGDHWTNLRNCDYIYEFNNVKLIYVYTAKKHDFLFDTDARLINNSSYMLASDNKFLWAFFNSKLFSWYQKIKFVAYGDADVSGRVKLDFNKMEEVPIRNIDESLYSKFESIVSEILTTKRDNPLSNVTDKECLIDEMIYDLYNITQPERIIIEGGI
jgi:adenine-specific DNA-methyltransferase